MFSLTAKCLIGANNAIIPTYTAMQYPTIVRNFGVGMGNLASGIALILVPSLWQLVRKASNNALSRSLHMILHFLGTLRPTAATERHGSLRSGRSHSYSSDEGRGRVLVPVD